MPKENFFKLDDEKRARIIRAARDEFLEYKDGYKKASVKRIAKRADISTGSFYEYFEGKNDLFFYLLDKITEKKRIQNYGELLTLRERIMTLIDADISGYYYDQDDRELLYMLLKSDEALKREFYFTYILEESTSIFLKKLTQEQAEGLIRPDLNLEFAAYLMTTIAYNILQYMGSDYDLEKYRSVNEEWVKIIFSGIYSK